MNTLLLIIACCLLFGADRTRAGLGCLIKVFAFGFFILFALLVLVTSLNT